MAFLFFVFQMVSYVSVQFFVCFFGVAPFASMHVRIWTHRSFLTHTLVRIRGDNVLTALVTYGTDIVGLGFEDTARNVSNICADDYVGMVPEGVRILGFFPREEYTYRVRSQLCHRGGT